MIFVEPKEDLLVCADPVANTMTVLCEAPVYPEFIVTGNRILCRQLDTGRICSMNMDGSDVVEYYQLPFGCGAMLDGVLYFVDTETGMTNSGTVLYRYELASGMWSTSILPGNHLSPIRRTLVFEGETVCYISEEGGVYSVIRQALATGERTVLHTSSMPILERYGRDGILCFYDEAAGALMRFDGSNRRAIAYEARRVYAVLSEGILFGKPNDQGTGLFFGNTAGSFAEFTGGVVMAAGGSRGLVNRIDDAGLDELAIVKYPEDRVFYHLNGKLNCVITDGEGHAAAFFYDINECYLIDLQLGTVRTCAAKPIFLHPVSPVQYVLETSKFVNVVGDQDLHDCTPRQVAEAFAQAVADGDHLSVNRILSEFCEPSAYPDVRMKSWNVARLESADKNKIGYEIVYTPYTEGDLRYLDWMPAGARNCLLIFDQQDGEWTLTEQEESAWNRGH